MPDGSRDGFEPGKGARWNLRRKTRSAQAARLALAFAIGLLGAFCFLQIKVPLAWFLGALAFCIAAAVLDIPYERPRAFSSPVRAVLGVTVGTAFTPMLLGNLGGMIGSLLLLVPFMLAIMGAGMLFFSRLARFDKPTAFFSAVPGGLTDMVSMAADAGANTRAVTLVQAVRIVVIVFLLPFWVQMTGDRAIGGVMPPGAHITELSLVDAAILIGLGLGGWQIAKWLGMAGAPLVGPMILSGIAHATGLTAAQVPIELIIFAQITLGILLGAQFRGVTWREFSTTLVWGSIFAVILVAVTAVVAIGVSRLTGFDSTNVLLAFAPGGQSELNLLAYILHLDVAFTALHHLVRIAIVIAGRSSYLRATSLGAMAADCHPRNPACHKCRLPSAPKYAGFLWGRHRAQPTSASSLRIGSSYERWDGSRRRNKTPLRRTSCSRKCGGSR
jgi:membrane AbrB-like protein